MFAHLAGSSVVRAAAAVAIATEVETPNSFNRQRGLTYVVTTTGRTVGTCAVAVQQSFDEGATWVATTINPTDGSATISSNTTKYFPVNESIPTYLQFVLTPAGGFDGSVAITARSSDTYGLPENV